MLKLEIEPNSVKIIFFFLDAKFFIENPTKSQGISLTLFRDAVIFWEENITEREYNYLIRHVNNFLWQDAYRE